MRTTLFYFSATGNCLKVARDLARELGNTNIVNIAAVMDKELDLSAEAIGLVYPVYCFGMPSIIKRFIAKLAGAKDKYLFAIVTGGALAADTLGQNARLFKSLGLKLYAGFFIKMPGNYTPFYGAPAAEQQKKIFEQEARRIAQIAQVVGTKKQARLERGNRMIHRLISNPIYRFSAKFLPLEDKHFWTDDKCNSCGTCVQVCPVRNVKLVDGKPAWLHHCEQCFACLQWCPQEAIQFGKSTIGRKRYHNPEIKLHEIVIKNTPAAA